MRDTAPDNETRNAGARLPVKASRWVEENMKTNNLSIGGQIMTMFSNKFGLRNLFHFVCLQQTDAKQKSSDTLKEDIERKQ